MPLLIRLFAAWARVGGLPLCVLCGVACREPAPPRNEPPSLQALTPSDPAVAAARPPIAPAPIAPALESSPRLEIDARLYPPDRPLQQLAFTEQRLAQLGQGELIVRSLPELRRIARVPTPGARNVVAGVGGDFVAVGSDHVYRLASLDQRAEVLAPVPRLGPLTILPATDSSDHFWLAYEGIRALPEFDLQEAVLTPYVSVLGWTELVGFDGRATTSSGDGGFIYTTPGGVRRRDAAGGAQEMLIGGWSEQIWRLLPDGAQGGLWAATPLQLHLLEPRWRSIGAAGAPEVHQRFELPPHSVALASQGREVAVLAVESFQPTRARLRIEVYTRGVTEPRGWSFDDALPAPTDVGASASAPPEFSPELALAPGRPWVAVFGFSLGIFDWRRGVRLFPPPEAPPVSQNLAPGSH